MVLVVFGCFRLFVVVLVCVSCQRLFHVRFKIISGCFWLFQVVLVSSKLFYVVFDLLSYVILFYVVFVFIVGGWFRLV